MDEFTMNLQLFADGENIEDNANLDNAGDIDTQNVVDDGDTQPEVDVDPGQQSIDKDNPANHAFAEMRRKLKEQELQLKTMSQKQKETDDYYANLAKSKGRNDIKTADEYFKAVRQEELSADYQATNDPIKLASLIKEMIMPEIQKQEISTDIDSMFNSELEEYNKEFKGTLKSLDDILTLPNNEKIIGYMQNNSLSLTEAYKLANPEKVAAANKQAIINQVKGHNHVKANSNGGTVEKINVTAAEVAQWKQWFPEKPDEQCRKEIAANKKLLEE
jgi:hypothetical protein